MLRNLYPNEITVNPFKTMSTTKSNSLKASPMRARLPPRKYSHRER